MYTRERKIKLEDVITVDIIGLQDITGLGRNTAAKVGEEAGAVVRIGSRKLYNVEKIKKYMDNLTGRKE